MAMTMKIPSRELWSYFGYGLGQCFSFGLVGSFINYFYTDVLGISALAASTIFLIARAWDAVHDPLFASIMDTINSRFGKFRHFLLIAPLLITIRLEEYDYNGAVAIAALLLVASFLSLLLINLLPLLFQRGGGHD